MPNISIVGTQPPQQQQHVQQQPKVQAAEGGEATKKGKDVKNDGDKDDGAVSPNVAAQANAHVAATAPAPKPVTNTLGQLIGKTVDVQA